MVITRWADNNGFKGVERGKELQLAGAVTHALTRIREVKTSELSEPPVSKPIELRINQLHQMNLRSSL
jgi:hypothetical protein